MSSGYDIEKALEKVDNVFDLVVLASRRARDISLSTPATSLGGKIEQKPTTKAIEDIATGQVEIHDLRTALNNYFDQFYQNQDKGFDMSSFSRVGDNDLKKQSNTNEKMDKLREKKYKDIYSSQNEDDIED